MRSSANSSFALLRYFSPLVIVHSCGIFFLIISVFPNSALRAFLIKFFLELPSLLQKRGNTRIYRRGVREKRNIGRLWLRRYKSR